MAKRLNGASTVKEDRKLRENLIRVISEYVPFPMFVVDEVFSIVLSYDKTIQVLATATKYKTNPITLADELVRILGEEIQDG